MNETLGNSSNSSANLGNTSPSSAPVKKGKKKQISPAIRWCFTLHKYTEEEVSSIYSIIQENCKFAIFAKENGESGETPHLQGYIEFKNKMRPSGVFGIPRIHWETAKGSRQHNIDYILKEGGEVFWWPKKYDININLYSWQKDLKTIIDTIPDDRSIYWIWEAQGCAGKTTFQKWIYLNYKKVVVLSGKCEDMKNGIVQYNKTNDCLPEIVLVNIPRCNSNFVSISGLEQIKDMFFFCGKYEGGMVCGPNPHVIVFANEPPEADTMSADRWKIWNIDKSETIGICKFGNCE